MNTAEVGVGMGFHYVFDKFLIKVWVTKIQPQKIECIGGSIMSNQSDKSGELNKIIMFPVEDYTQWCYSRISATTIPDVLNIYL